jgi:hypothetical protein
VTALHVKHRVLTLCWLPIDAQSDVQHQQQVDLSVIMAVALTWVRNAVHSKQCYMQQADRQSCKPQLQTPARLVSADNHLALLPNRV